MRQDRQKGEPGDIERWKRPSASQDLVVTHLSGKDMPAEGFEPPTNGLQIWPGTNVPKLAIRSTLFLLIFR